MGDFALVGAAFAFGIGSALLPVLLNAELYVGGNAALVSESIIIVVVLSLSVGTVIGKAIVFELARKGRKAVARGERRPTSNRWILTLRSVSDWLLGLLDRPYAGGLAVLASSLFGVPPLAIVTIAAGVSHQSRYVFLTMVFLGRTAQFLVIAFVVGKVL